MQIRSIPVRCWRACPACRRETREPRRLADKLSDAFTRTGHWVALSKLFQPLLELLATGQPVTTARLAESIGQDVHQVSDVITGLPGVELDDHGRIIGYGLTQRPTPHQFHINGHQLYTWCALDTLIFPILIGHPAEVTSPCHATGTPVRLSVDPDVVTCLQPATAVVSIVTPTDMTDVRATFCHDVHFFSSPEAAGPWLTNHPDSAVVPVADAFAVGRTLAVSMFTHSSAADCC